MMNTTIKISLLFSSLFFVFSCGKKDPDTTKPTCLIISPKENDTFQDLPGGPAIYFEYGAQDAGGLKSLSYNILDLNTVTSVRNNTTNTSDNSLTEAFGWNVSVATLTKYTFTITGVDAAGNTSSANRNFYIKN